MTNLDRLQGQDSIHIEPGTVYLTQRKGKPADPVELLRADFSTGKALLSNMATDRQFIGSLWRLAERKIGNTLVIDCLPPPGVNLPPTANNPEQVIEDKTTLSLGEDERCQLIFKGRNGMLFKIVGRFLRSASSSRTAKFTGDEYDNSGINFPIPVNLISSGPDQPGVEIISLREKNGR